MDKIVLMPVVKDARSEQAFKSSDRALGMINADDLRAELRQSYKMIDALCYSYHDVYYASLSTGEMRSYRYSRVTRDMFGKAFEQGSFETNFYSYVRNAVYYDDQKLFEPILTISNLRKLFSRQLTYGFSYRVLRENEIHYCQVELVRILESKDEFVFAFKNLDKQHQHIRSEREKTLAQVKNLIKSYNELIGSSVNNIVAESKKSALAADGCEKAVEVLDMIQSRVQMLLGRLDSIVSEAEDLPSLAQKISQTEGDR
ncbi:MAG: hypothetical protein K6C05_02630 [Anaerovibrio sp.]|uniref:hypothetical protein n=1 Tax=Anaerovibrio sp. TaxID=1872532 RepID=UPI0025FF66B0|nr:hypothetical protein [Anaerovibrio sp.]MCR5175726.1 hypothetical protein [Anaerovibrio sp.]